MEAAAWVAKYGQCFAKDEIPETWTHAIAWAKAKANREVGVLVNIQVYMLAL